MRSDVKKTEKCEKWENQNGEKNIDIYIFEGKGGGWSPNQNNGHLNKTVEFISKKKKKKSFFPIFGLLK